MKSILASTFFALPMLLATTAFAQNPFSPNKVIGRTFQFSIEGGEDPLATQGVWTGTFLNKPEDRFVIRNITGSTSSGSGIWKYIGSPFTGSHSYRITPFLPSDEAATITFWPEDIAYRFFIAIGESSQWGVIAGPEIGVQQPFGNNLLDGGPVRKMGSAKVDKSGKPKEFKIRNTGNADLTDLTIKLKGAHKNDYKLGKLGKKVVKPGESTTFEVTFNPSSKGTRLAAIQIFSNDVDENPFDIKLSGIGK